MSDLYAVAHLPKVLPPDPMPWVRDWLDEAFADSDVWRELGRRLCEVGMYTGDRSLLEP